MALVRQNPLLPPTSLTVDVFLRTSPPVSDAVAHDPRRLAAPYQAPLLCAVRDEGDGGGAITSGVA